MTLPTYFEPCTRGWLYRDQLEASVARIPGGVLLLFSGAAALADPCCDSTDPVLDEFQYYVKCWSCRAHINAEDNFHILEWGDLSLDSMEAFIGARTGLDPLENTVAASAIAEECKKWLEREALRNASTVQDV